MDPNVLLQSHVNLFIMSATLARSANIQDNSYDASPKASCKNNI